MDGQKIVFSILLFIIRMAIILLVVMGIYRVGVYSYTYCYSIVSDAAVDKKPGRDVRVTVSEDMEPEQLSLLLEKNRLIKDADIFRIQLKINKYEDKLKAGVYVLNSSMTPKELMSILAGEGDGEDEEGDGEDEEGEEE